jgi:hypothetical protein
MQPAQQGFAADRVQRPLRCRFQPRLMTGVRPAPKRCERGQYAYSILCGDRLALSCRCRVGVAPGWRSRAYVAHSDRRNCVRRSGAGSGVGTRRKSPRSDARLHVYGNPNTSTCGIYVDTAVSRFRNERVGGGAARSSRFPISDRCCDWAFRNLRGKHRSDIRALVVVALRNCAQIIEQSRNS